MIQDWRSRIRHIAGGRRPSYLSGKGNGFMRGSLFGVFAVALCSAAGDPAAAIRIRDVGLAQSRTFDLLIRNARIFDGSGNPWTLGDVGVRQGRIAAVGDLAGATAPRT